MQVQINHILREPQEPAESQHCCPEELGDQTRRFILINLIAAHLASDCGPPAVFGRDSCADDIARAGWPLQFYEDVGLAYRHNFDRLFLLINLGVGVAFAILPGRWFSRNKKTLLK